MSSGNKHHLHLPVFAIIRYSLFTGLHLGLLFFLLYLDKHFILSDTALAILAIPVGLVNCALLLSGFMRLKGFTKAGLLYFFVVIINFLCYTIISLNLYSQAGSMAN